MGEERLLGRSGGHLLVLRETRKRDKMGECGEEIKKISLLCFLPFPMTRRRKRGEREELRLSRGLASLSRVSQLREASSFSLSALPQR